MAWVQYSWLKLSKYKTLNLEYKTEFMKLYKWYFWAFVVHIFEILRGWKKNEKYIKRMKNILKKWKINLKNEKYVT